MYINVKNRFDALTYYGEDGVGKLLELGSNGSDYVLDEGKVKQFISDAIDEVVESCPISNTEIIEGKDADNEIIIFLYKIKNWRDSILK